MCKEQVHVSISSSLPAISKIQFESYLNGFYSLPPSHKAISKFYKIPHVTFSHRSICNNILLNVDHIGEAMSTQQQTDVWQKEESPYVYYWQYLMVRTNSHPFLIFVFSFILKHSFLIYRGKFSRHKSDFQYVRFPLNVGK